MYEKKDLEDDLQETLIAKASSTSYSFFIPKYTFLLEEDSYIGYKFTFSISVNNEILHFIEHSLETNTISIKQNDIVRMAFMSTNLGNSEFDSLTLWNVRVENICYVNNSSTPAFLHVVLFLQKQNDTHFSEYHKLVKITDDYMDGRNRRWMFKKPMHCFHWCESLSYAPPRHNCPRDFQLQWNFSYEPSEFLFQELKRLHNTAIYEYNPVTLNSDNWENHKEINEKKKEMKGNKKNVKTTYSKRLLIVFDIVGIICNLNEKVQKNRGGEKTKVNFDIDVRPDILETINLLEKYFDFAVYTTMEKRKATRILEQISDDQPSFHRLYKENGQFRLLTKEECHTSKTVLLKKFVSKITESIKDKNNLRYDDRKILMIETDPDIFVENVSNAVVFWELRLYDFVYNESLCEKQYQFFQILIKEIDGFDETKQVLTVPDLLHFVSFEWKNPEVKLVAEIKQSRLSKL